MPWHGKVVLICKITQRSGGERTNAKQANQKKWPLAVEFFKSAKK